MNKFAFLCSVVLSKYFYDFPIQLSEVSYRGRGGGNHPETFEYAVKKGACPYLPADVESIYARANLVYGTIIEIACLKLDDGTMIAARRNGQGAWSNQTVTADQAGCRPRGSRSILCCPSRPSGGIHPRHGIHS